MVTSRPLSLAKVLASNGLCGMDAIAIGIGIGIGVGVGVGAASTSSST